MKHILFFFLTISFFSCQNLKVSTEKEELPVLEGAYDNFLQHWKQNTSDEIHRDKSGDIHEHVHVKFIKEKEQNYKLEFYKDRNNETKLGEKKLVFSWGENEANSDDIINLNKKDGYWISEDESFKINGDTLWMSDMNILPTPKGKKYELIRCRYFTGWIQYPMPGYPDSIYFENNLMIHDQGGMAELMLDDVDYTVELTQLEFNHTIKLMKLAVYDMPLDSVGINSRSISYTWTSPEAKRLGINLRKVISGWTFIEEGFVNRNTLKIDKKK